MARLPDLACTAAVSALEHDPFYRSIAVGFAGDHSRRRDAWYLSIIAIAPEAQGQGLGRLLLAPTLAEADAAGAVCYLETFSPRNLTFYERAGFGRRARIDEPTAPAAYTSWFDFPWAA